MRDKRMSVTMKRLRLDNEIKENNISWRFTKNNIFKKTKLLQEKLASYFFFTKNK